ncbi:phosphoglycerate mutase family protein GPM3 KNAG_0K01200 [Huiozyma naganishii CBS 8797]|uniref:Phosphoglycerate mutase n=1 Tax=Huiozyma naganishii (strain ATCC MYA-139 / BCRC 22969 / CBS 8797 / KCTC 17520 / NBRC 10181 / NCYC 3082 / Yp74L-3) TaxID=1071383 RepID=J7RCA3_HUIN7|nr:hypothetical protein KNAG_0K01200 [Kazachstania naganishii CBS 8797]CCK72485.1 hypothetical protein KNAG_0K01200 [Kazachstania naganishii CBS 8797]
MTAQSATLKIFVLRHGQSELNHENIFCGWIDARLTEKGKSQAAHSGELIKQYCEEHNVPLPQIGYTSRLVRTQQTMEAILNQLHLRPDFQVIGGDAAQLKQLPFPNETDSDVIPVLQTWRLNERHYGSWQGQRKPKILKEYGDEEYMYIRRDYQGKPPHADLNLEMVQQRGEVGSLTGYEFKEPNRQQKYAVEEGQGEKLPESESLKEVVDRINPFLDNVVLRFGKEQNLASCLVVGHGSSVRSILKVFDNISDDDIKDIDIPNGIPLVLELNRNDFSPVKRFYLDPESAVINAAKVRKEGFEKNP